MLHHGIDSQDLEVGRQGHDGVGQSPAIDLDGGTGLSEHGDILVHDAAGNTGELAFGLLAQLRQSQRFDGPAAQHRQRQRDFERGGRTESRTRRDSAMNADVLRCDRIASRDQLTRDADNVIGPVAGGRKARQIGDSQSPDLFRSSVWTRSPPVIGGRGGGDAGQVERDRQDEAQVVIGMFANQIDASGARNARVTRFSAPKPAVSRRKPA
jgi:hypothetical protein